MSKKRKQKTSSTLEDEDNLDLERHSMPKTTKKKKSVTDREIEHAILKNLVELQKVQTDLSEKFSHLATEISNLLALFEVTARHFAKNIPQNDQFTKDKEFLEKIDKLLDQNKTLAKGLTLMEERLRERLYTGSQKPPAPEKKAEEEFTPSMNTRSRPMPRF